MNHIWSLLLVLASPAQVPVPAEWQACAGSDPELALAACSALITERREQGRALALAHFNRAIARRTLARRHRALGRPGDPDPTMIEAQAMADYDRALTLDPAFAEALTNRAAAWYDRGDHVRAVADCDAAIRLSPTMAEAWNNRALAYLRQLRYDLATRDFDQTIRLEKNYGNAMIMRTFGPMLPGPTSLPQGKAPQS